MPDPQRCLGPPTIALPALPFPLSATLPKISISFNLKFCCKLPPLPTWKPRIKIPPLVLNPALTVLKKFQTIIQQYLNKIQIKCPRR